MDIFGRLKIIMEQASFMQNHLNHKVSVRLVANLYQLLVFAISYFKNFAFLHFCLKAEVSLVCSFGIQPLHTNLENIF